MGQAYIPSQSFTNIAISTVVATAVSSNSVLLLEVNGIVYPNGFREEYLGGSRTFYPTVDNNGQLYITCQAVTYDQDLPAYTLPASARVLVISI